MLFEKVGILHENNSFLNDKYVKMLEYLRSFVSERL